ncbi:MAG: hypothetical protein ACK47B_28070 [Armatimonadota bacterium]
MELLRKVGEYAPQRWLPDYLHGRLTRRRAPDGAAVHLLFSIVDHWEPSVGGVSAEEAWERVRDWTTLYPRAAAAHADADGVPPQYSFFYPHDEYRRGELAALSELCASGFGEVEVHLHHHDDTSASLTAKLEEAVGLYREAGCLGARRDGTAAYGFIHGDWALDNSRCEHGRNYCGVNDEIRVLARTGCYADFTFPVLGGEAQPRWVNRVMWVTDDPDRPRSYDRGQQARVGRAAPGDLPLIPGPVAIHRDGRGRPRLDDGQLTGGNPWRPDRVDAWVAAGVHVIDRPEWIFVKLHTHGCADSTRLALLKGELDRLWTDLERRYNDGDRYRLHYVTARESYNILRAAEDGLDGDPGRYRDYEIAPPRHRRARRWETLRLSDWETVAA